MAVDRDFPHSLPAPRRAELMERLGAALPRQLGWLEQHGYRVGDAGWPSVRLESPNARLEVGYGAVHGPALSLGVALREHGDEEGRSLGTLQRLSGVPEHASRDWVIETDADVERALERVSEQLRTIEPLVAGDPAAFADVRRRSSELLAEIGLEEDLRTARPEARDAFKAREFERVVALLDPLEGHLERHEQGWLDYARRRLGSA